jgi:hypothetical protein
MSAGPPIPGELWQQVPPAAQAAISALIQHYEQRLAELEARLKQNSTNSSKPGFPGYRVGTDGSIWSAWTRSTFQCTHSIPLWDYRRELRSLAGGAKIRKKVSHDRKLLVQSRRRSFSTVEECLDLVLECPLIYLVHATARPFKSAVPGSQSLPASECVLEFLAFGSLESDQTTAGDPV